MENGVRITKLLDFQYAEVNVGRVECTEDNPVIVIISWKGMFRGKLKPYETQNKPN